MKIPGFLIWFFVALALCADEGGGGAFVIPIHGDIEPSMTTHVRRQAGSAVGDGAAFLIFDIDTFGGRVDSALQISSFIGSLEGVKTVAYIRQSPEGMGVSWSAGALIAMSCSVIYMAPGTSIGAAAPVIQGQEGMQSAGEKSVSAVRSQMAALAEKNGHPVPIALAMVDYDVALVEVEESGRVSAVFMEEASRLEKESSGRIKRGPVVSAKGKLLSLTAGEALRYGLSSGTESSYSSLLVTIGAGPEIRTLEPGAADSIVAFLTSGGLQGVLILIGIAALFLEIATPGFGIPGTVAIICFLTIFGANGMLGNVGSVEILLFLVGAGLLVLEIFVIPGFGVAGISGIVFIGVALVLSMQDFVIPDVSWEWDILYRNILTVVAGLSAGIIGIVVLALFAPKLHIFDRLTLRTAIRGTSGGPLPDGAEAGQAAAEGGDYFFPADLAGRCGKAVTVLRPSGRAEFGGAEYSVETDGVFLPAGTPLVVVRVRGNHILVKQQG
ncbi:MAG: nodulation protein NfeD [Spirochaetales bacterium]|jgi:membrane-bound serine protease (ClpP class)|nr:nodulation protein NfeD [Spirochaetales bacterium]